MYKEFGLSNYKIRWKLPIKYIILEYSCSLYSNRCNLKNKLFESFI